MKGEQKSRLITLIRNKNENKLIQTSYIELLIQLVYLLSYVRKVIIA